MKNILLATLICLMFHGCTKEQLVRIAISKDPKQAAKNTITNRHNAYKYNPLLAISDAKTLRRNFNLLIKTLKGNVGKEWGKKETVLASKHRYVKYTQNYKSRAIINFDSGLITVETLDTVNPLQSLHSAIVTTLLTPDDPRSVDLYSDKTSKLTGKPYLHGLVLNHKHNEISSPADADKFSSYLVSNKKKIRYLSNSGNHKTVTYVNLNMVGNHADIRARRYQPVVSRYSKQYKISKSLVFAIIKTESNFNPFAVSSAPAYGLMQLVPTTGGRDAFRKVNGRDGIPSSQYLFNTENNIALGTAYLNIINYEYLKKIRNPVSREYCTIAAYNTGSGNVLRTFSSNRSTAAHIINTMQPHEVYNKLKSQLASHEARRYLVKVTRARKDYVNI
jgi:membrane-bound lytic murein transglycosylase C